ncbi:MAG: DoxX family protein [Arthrobacter sp.]|jgi:putative oxidoreductase|nr:DoxX family protein [Arthrobacter sp.]
MKRTPFTTDVALLILRVVTGALMLAHGAQKVFEFTPAGTGASFAQMGVPLGETVGPFIAFAELIGGALLLLGLGTRVVGAVFVADMLGALFIVHLPAGVFAADGGYELVALLGAVSLALVIAGAGRFSLDALASRAFGARRGTRVDAPAAA